MSLTPLFPACLEEGSTGPAVSVLQILLVGWRLNRSLRPDGVYGKETALAVVRLQSELGLKGDSINGKFDPSTKQAIKDGYGVDFDNLPAEQFSVVTDF